MTRTAFAATLLWALGLIVLVAPSWSQDPVAALDAMVKGKPPAARQVPMRVDVVGYEVSKNPRVAAQLKSVAEAGGGGFSTAGIKDIKKVMTGVVSGSGASAAKTQPRGGRLQRGPTVIRHGNIER